MHAMNTGLLHACVTLKSDSDLQCSVGDDRNVHVPWDGGDTCRVAGC